MKIESSLLIVKLLSVELNQISGKNKLFCVVFHNNIKKRTEIVEMPADTKPIWHSLIFPKIDGWPIHFQVYTQNGEEAQLIGECSLEFQQFENQIVFIMDLVYNDEPLVGKLHVELKGFFGQGEQTPQFLDNQKEVGQQITGQLNIEQQLQVEQSIEQSGQQDNKPHQKNGTVAEGNKNLGNGQTMVIGLKNKSIKNSNFCIIGNNCSLKIEKGKNIVINGQQFGDYTEKINFETRKNKLYIYQESCSQFENQQFIQIQQQVEGQRDNQILEGKQQSKSEKRLQKKYVKIKLKMKQSERKFKKKMRGLNEKLDKIIKKNEHSLNRKMGALDKKLKNNMRHLERQN